MDTSNSCKRCKRTDLPLMKLGKYKETQQYSCRPCNNYYGKKYRETVAGKLSVKLANERSWKKEPRKRKARASVNTAVVAGRVLKPSECNMCEVSTRIEGHHMDYSKPLEVIWLCPSCHASYHK